MKIHHVLDGISVIITNEERSFIKHFGDNISLTSLDEHADWVAQNLVRKGIYSISKDKKYITKVDHA